MMTDKKKITFFQWYVLIVFIILGFTCIWLAVLLEKQKDQLQYYEATTAMLCEINNENFNLTNDLLTLLPEMGTTRIPLLNCTEIMTP